MTTLREAAQQALEALTAVTTRTCAGTDGMDITPINDAFDMADTAITALKAALEQPDEKALPPWPPVSQWQRSCAVCNIGASGQVIGYVCSRSDCPTRITCGGTV